MKVFNLATKRILVKHTGKNLKKIILSVLAKFGLKQENIYTITTDNGSNMIKDIDLMSEFDQDNENEQNERAIWDEDSIDVHGNEETMELLLKTDWNSSVIGCKFSPFLLKTF